MKKLIAILLCTTLTATPVFASDTESEPDKGIFGMFEDAANFISDTTTEVGKATQDAWNTTGDALTEFGTNVSKQTENTVNEIGKFFSDVGYGIADVAAQTSETVSNISKDIADQSVNMADQALSTLNGAANVVVDSTGNVINMAGEGINSVSTAGMEALETIAANGAELVSIADKAVMDLDLTSPENVEKARTVINNAIEEAQRNGYISKKLNMETLRIIEDVVFGTTVYGYQYSHGIISLPEYTAIMSEIIIKAGLPTGVGYIASLLPIPGGKYIAKEATAFLIQVAFGEDRQEVLYEDVVDESDPENEKIAMKKESIQTKDEEQTTEENNSKEEIENYLLEPKELMEENEPNRINEVLQESCQNPHKK